MEQHNAIGDKIRQENALEGGYENAIEVRNVDVCYKTLGEESIKSILFRKKTKSKQVFRAINDVSFDVHKGEILGVIGKNGSGKSTLLRLLAGIFCADRGTVDLKGNNVSLLSIGVGFQTELSGRDNVFLSGLLLGYSLDEIRNKMDGIIEFSELGEFIDKPVKTYSSGMYSKLAFSITANLQTDILLIDEVLSVGDVKFAKKSYDYMKNMMRDEKQTVIFVSHALPSISELCDRVMWINDGVIMEIGETKTVLRHYKTYMK